MASIYQPAEDGTFTCLDGSSKLPYEYVNDDYCDCNDGTDEPGMINQYSDLSIYVQM